MKVAITGSSGFIGTALARALEERGDSVVRVVRAKGAQARWDPEGGSIDTGALIGIDAAVHLAGEGIGERRWSPRQKARILGSRVGGTSLLARALARMEPKPRVLVSASAMGYYGDRGDEILTEASPSGEGFLALVCRQWEAATSPAETAGIRVCHVRTGLVVGRTGGLLKRLLLPFRLGLGGRLASGRQWMSWVTIQDQVRAIVHLLDDEGARGPFNVAAPNAVRNDEFTAVLARVLRRPALVPIPKALIAIPYGRELADDLLSSIHIVPQRLTERSFRFDAQDLEEALRSELKR